MASLIHLELQLTEHPLTVFMINISQRLAVIISLFISIIYCADGATFSRKDLVGSVITLIEQNDRIGNKGSLLLFSVIPESGSGLHLISTREIRPDGSGSVLVPLAYKAYFSHNAKDWSPAVLMGDASMRHDRNYVVLVNRSVDASGYVAMLGIPVIEMEKAASTYAAGKPDGRIFIKLKFAVSRPSATPGVIVEEMMDSEVIVMDTTVPGPSAPR